MTLRITNSTFESVNEGDFVSLDAAYRATVASALAIASEEVTNGAPSSIAQISVSLTGQGGGMRGAVAVSTARIVDGPAHSLRGSDLIEPTNDNL